MHIEALQPAEMRQIAKDADTSLKTVSRLVAAGVDPEDLDRVLECRAFMTQYDHDPRSKTPGKVIAAPTIDAMIYAYKKLGGDVDELELVVETANELLSEVFGESAGSLNAALYRALNEYKRMEMIDGE